MQRRPWIVLFFCAGFWGSSAVALADGGGVVFSGESGSVRVTMFVAPVPPRVGPVDLSLLVQDLGSLEPIVGYAAHLTLKGDDATLEPIEAVMDRSGATNALFQSALIEMPLAGTWQVMLEVKTGGTEHAFQFPLTVQTPAARFWDVAIWIVLPLIPLLLFLAGKLRRVAKEVNA